MRNFLFFAIGILPRFALGQLAAPVADGIIVKDHGRAKAFVVAADEIGRRQPDGRFKVESDNAAKALKTHSNETQLVLYPANAAHTLGNRRLLTGKLRVVVEPGTDAAALAASVGVERWKAAEGVENQYIFEVPTAQESLGLVKNLRANAMVVAAEHLLARQQQRRGRPNDPLFSLQWHLYNTGQNGGVVGNDAGVVSIWGSFSGSGYRGRGVTIGIVDDGVQYTHPDLKSNYNAYLDYDWNDNSPYTAYPSQTNEDFHGTSVAGVAAARGNNGIGVCGVAPQATITGLRLIAGYEDDNDESQAFRYRNDRISIKNNSWGPTDDGKTMEAPGPLASQALMDSATYGRYGKGEIFVWAAGNGREYNDNSNYDGYANSIYTIAVTAISDHGRATFYGEGGANIIVGAPSDDKTNSGIVTTDLTGSNGYNYSGTLRELSDRNYTRTFGGTSSATPVVSGVVALMLQKNPKLGWRDVQEILIRTAKKNNATNAYWITNAAGFNFHPDFGAGLINGSRAVRLASTWTNLGPQTQYTASDTTRQDYADGGSLTRTFTFSQNQRVEHVTVKLNVATNRRGQLQIILTSPSGTVSELASIHNDSNDNIDWTYMTVRNWGESSVGTWTLKMRDGTLGSGGGTFNSAVVTIFGSDVSPP